MDYGNYIWECDYGRRTPFLSAVGPLLDAHNADIMETCAIFVNNNPYNFEFYICFRYDFFSNRRN